MNDKPLPTNVVPLREDGPRIAAFLNGVDGGNRPTDMASAVGVHLDPSLGLKPAVPGSLLMAPVEPTAPQLAPAASSDAEQDEDEGTDVGPIHYAHKLHQAGESAIAIVANMCESEFAQGNPRNLPEPILGWYVMTLTYQLLVLEACNDSREALCQHAEQLRLARAAFGKYTGSYANGVREEVADALTRRKVWTEGDHTYGGRVEAPQA